MGGRGEIMLQQAFKVMKMLNSKPKLKTSGLKQGAPHVYL